MAEKATDSMSVSMSGLEPAVVKECQEAPCRGTRTEQEAWWQKGQLPAGAEVGASREGSLGEAKVSNAWTVSSEDGEIPGPAEMEAAGGSTGGFLEGVVTNLITDGVGS